MASYSKWTYVCGFLITIIFVPVFAPYDLQCPEPPHWKLRAMFRCGNIMKYKCLYDDNNEYYIENCTKPDIEHPGHKLVWRRNLDRADCRETRYQPWIFSTTETSDCVLLKSKCNEEGQIIYNVGKTSEDTKCRCDSTRGYAFVYKPNDPCFCFPSTEDCTCYKNPSHTAYEGKTQSTKNNENWSASRTEKYDVAVVGDSFIEKSCSAQHKKDEKISTSRPFGVIYLTLGCIVVCIFGLITGKCASWLGNEVPKHHDDNFSGVVQDVDSKTQSLAYMVETNTNIKLKCDGFFNHIISERKNGHFAITYGDDTDTKMCCLFEKILELMKEKKNDNKWELIKTEENCREKRKSEENETRVKRAKFETRVKHTKLSPVEIDFKRKLTEEEKPPEKKRKIDNLY